MLPIEAMFPETPPYVSSPASASTTEPSPARILLAWCVLTLVHAFVVVAGFSRLYRVVHAWPTLGRAPANAPGYVDATCAALNRARVYCVKSTWCLHSAAAAVALLRSRGIPAEMVIGVRRIPFRAHAWVLADNRVVLNNRTRLDANYTVITRC
jgi:hypothetical protein